MDLSEYLKVQVTTMSEIAQLKYKVLDILWDYSYPLCQVRIGIIFLLEFQEEVKIMCIVVNFSSHSSEVPAIEAFVSFQMIRHQ